MKLSNPLKFIISLLICQAAGIFGSLLTFNAIQTWYITLKKPEFVPPGSLIGMIWIVIYSLMAISLFLIWSKGLKSEEHKFAIKVFGVQLLLNALWSPIFFNLRSPFFAFLIIIALWIAIAATIYLFYKISRMASYILIPYILWVTFAAYLNFIIWQLNAI